MTKNARRILDVICASSGHLTAEEIYCTLLENGEKMVLATVYNNLSRLYEQGEVRKVCVEGYPDRYDRATRHDHLVCRRCGSLKDICFGDLTGLLKARTDEELLGYELQAVYLCEACRRAQAESAAACGKAGLPGKREERPDLTM